MMRQLSSVHTDPDAWAAIVGVLCVLVLAVWCLPDASAGGKKLTPKSAPVQMKLADEMAGAEDWDEATRRWIAVLYYFGPSEFEARAEFEIGAIALQRGRSDLACSQWEKTIQRYPDTEWAERAAQALKLLGREPPQAPEQAAEPYVTKDTPGYERDFLIAKGDMDAGLYEFAVRDFLKVPNLDPGSPRGAQARFRIGTCQALLGHPRLAIAQWERVVEDYPDSEEAQRARGGVAAWRAVLEKAGFSPAETETEQLDADWTPFRSWETEADRGLSYAEDLYENGITAYALQEYAKVLCDIYAKEGEQNPHKPYARYRMGVCAYRLGDADAAVRQWRRLMADYPDSPWAERANRALSAVAMSDTLSSNAGRPAPELPAELPKPLIQRSHLAAQLMDCGLYSVASKEHLKIMFVLTALRPNPFQAEACYHLGVAHHRMGRPDLAVAAWQRCVEEYPETEWAEKAGAAISHAERREGILSAGAGGEPGR